MPDRAAASPAELEALHCKDRERQQRCRERARRGVILSGREHCGSLLANFTREARRIAGFPTFATPDTFRFHLLLL